MSCGSAVEPARRRSIIGGKIGAIAGRPKGPKGWMTIDTANIYYDHPYHAPLDHALNIDFVNEANGGRERVAIELSASAARELVAQILEALETGEKEHGLAGVGAEEDAP